MSFYTEEELSSLGLQTYGKNVKISKLAQIYNPSSISVGNNVRIDDFCMISAGTNPIVFGDNIHISTGVYIYGSAGLTMKSFSNLSAGVKLYTVNDDYSGEYLVGATVPEIYRNVTKLPTVIEKYAVVGCNTVLLPGITIGEGCAIGACSLVKDSCKEWSIYAGVPIRFIKSRSKNLISYTSYI